MEGVLSNPPTGRGREREESRQRRGREWEGGREAREGGERESYLLTLPVITIIITR